MIEQIYLVRYGAMSYVGRFSAALDGTAPLERGQTVVIQSERGVELGEVLISLDAADPARGSGRPEAEGARSDESTHESTNAPAAVLRVANTEDLGRARLGEERRNGQFGLCRRVLEELEWPWEVVDVEPLLEAEVTVLYYLGPHPVDVAPLRARFRGAYDLDVIFEPVGPGVPAEASAGSIPRHDQHGCGAPGCGQGGCGSGSSALSTDRSAEAQAASTARSGGCGSTAAAGCSSCGIMHEMARRSLGGASTNR
jgi:hypothetical protein